MNLRKSPPPLEHGAILSEMQAVQPFKQNKVQGTDTHNRRRIKSSETTASAFFKPLNTVLN